MGVDTRTSLPAMPATVISLARCIKYIVRAIVLLALLAEAYTFISPSSYIESYSALYRSLDKGWLSFALAYLVELLRLLFKAVNFFFCVDCGLLVCHSRLGTFEINTPREWGGAVYLKLPFGVYAFRWALAETSRVARWYIWYSGTVNRVMDLRPVRLVIGV